MLVLCAGSGAVKGLASNKGPVCSVAARLSPGNFLRFCCPALSFSRKALGSSSAFSRSPARVPSSSQPRAQAIEFDLEEEADFEEVDLPRKSVPAEVRCFDTARIHVEAGNGGRGCTAFRREKFVPKGGPSGGNGGEGGSVWMEAHAGLNSLSSFRRQVHFRASPGAPGVGSNKHGAGGSDTVITVPPGTVVRVSENGDAHVIAELLHVGQRALLAAGGRGGRGNASFKTAADNAPTLSEHGEKGQMMWVDLELKLVADVGIIGVPNAGKSTLLSVVSAAKPKVAPYPFTTLTPNLGVCELDFRTTVFADIPGLLEGAHTGTGLGHEFLRHTQRCRLLVHVVDGSSPDPIGDFKAIQTELELFNPELMDKPQVVAYNKMDLPDSADYADDVREFLRQQGVEDENIVAISAATGLGVLNVVRRARILLDEMPEPEPQPLPETPSIRDIRKQRSAARLDDFTIEPDLGGPRLWHVHGTALQRFAQMTNWDYYEATARFQRVLENSGVSSALRKQGILEGDTVVIGEVELEWTDDQSEQALYGAWKDAQKAKGAVLPGSARWPSATAR